jgi:four helix bundle protein
MSVSSYRDLVVWQKGMALVREAYRLARKLPKQEVFGLSSQIQRAAVSVPANIAEGHARDSTKEYLHHLSFCRGSLAELETLVTVADQLGYLESHDASDVLQRCDEISRMLRNLQRQLRGRMGEP